MKKLIHKFSHLFLLGTLVFSQGLRAETTETTYYIPDALGSPIAAMDEAGNIKWRKHYQPFGKEIEQDEASKDNRIGYTGHVHDRISGLTYMGARYYDPEIGRFLSMDPAAVNPNDPRTFNRYAYANNSPYNYVDPDGRNALVIEGIAIGLLYLAFAPGHEERVDTLKQIWKVYNESGNDVRGDNVRSTDNPADLEEDLAGQEIIGKLKVGEGEDISADMGDSRYDPVSGTHDKVRDSHSHSDGTVTEVHADRNRETGELSDKKFKDAPDNGKSRAGLYE
jgi:RHS repeat-associated protein